MSHLGQVLDQHLKRSSQGDEIGIAAHEITQPKAIVQHRIVLCLGLPVGGRFSQYAGTGPTYASL